MNTEQSWYVDPLDGTVNYAHHIPFFSVSIGYAYKGRMQIGIVYDPMRDEMFSAERGKGADFNGQPIHVSDTTELEKSLLVTGFPYDAWNTEHDNFENFVRFGKLTQGVRRFGSAALDASYVAAGRFDGFWELSLKPWDVAGGGLIAEEAGAKVTNIKNLVRLSLRRHNPLSPPLPAFTQKYWKIWEPPDLTVEIKVRSIGGAMRVELRIIG